MLHVLPKIYNLRYPIFPHTGRIIMSFKCGAEGKIIDQKAAGEESLATAHPMGKSANMLH
jgi:hypothetical protein